MENKTRFSNFVPERLIEAREARGLTLMDLSEKVGVTHQAISKYEKGKSTPSHEVLDKIVETLNLPKFYFLRPVIRNKKGLVFFRSRAAATVKSKKVHETRLTWLKQIHLYLESIVDFPTLNIPQYNNSEYYIPTDYEEIDDIALDVRKRWGLGNGPISNIVLLLEKKGAIIARANFSDYRIDACSEWGPSGRPYIFLDSEKTAVRSRFDIAHELGHLVLHSNIKKSEFNKNYKVIDKEADRFASAFLLPTPTFSNEVISSSIDHLMFLKKRWRTSIASIAYRAYQLNIFNENQHVYIRKKLARYKWIKKEPLDDTIEFENPTAIKQAIELILEHRVKTKNDLVYEIGLGREEIEILANLPSGYLEEDINDAPTKIIPFKFKNSM